MSYPPGGPPPPYYGHPPQHAAPGYTYVPTPVMMPMPMAMPANPQPPQQQPQPAYVTNNYYQAPQDTVHVVENAGPRLRPSIIGAPMIDWVPSTGGDAMLLSHRSVVGGKEGWDGSPLWIIRAHHSGDLVPGKLAVKHKSAYIPHNGKEVPVHNFEVLCAPSHAVHWLPYSNGQVPHGAIVAGNTHSAEPLYIGRTKHRGSITPGKVHPSHRCLYISFDGKEISFKDYDVLCKTGA